LFPIAQNSRDANRRATLDQHRAGISACLSPKDSAHEIWQLPLDSRSGRARRYLIPNIVTIGRQGEPDLLHRAKAMSPKLRAIFQLALDDIASIVSAGCEAQICKWWCWQRPRGLG
jgi:hypothetical protein